MANGCLSDAFADTVLLAVLTGDTSGLPASFWIGLTLVLPTDEDGTGIEPPDAVEYGPVEMVCEAGTWISMGEGSRSMESDVDVEFATAATDWGQILGYTFHDAETDGVYLGFGVVNPFIITAGMRARLPAGSVVWTLPAVTTT